MHPRGESVVASVKESVEVNVPVRRAYNQWTQFEDFPSFMEGVKEVRQLDDKRLFWRAEVACHQQAAASRRVQSTPTASRTERTTVAVTAGRK